MLKTTIGICDDELQMCKIIEKKIHDILNKQYGDDDEYFQIQIYSSAIELLEDIKGIDVLFLDIEMPEMDGLEAGKTIKDRNPKCRIIMATSNDKRYGEAFKINAHRYLNKPLKDEDIEEALESALNKAVGNRTIEVFQNRIKYNIAYDEILYIKSYNGYAEIYTTNNVFTKNESLDQIAEELDSRLFFRVHRQYIVGFRHVESVIKKVIRLKNGEELTISRRNLQKFEQSFVEYDLHFGG